MGKYLIRFSEQKWKVNGTGVRSKEFLDGTQRIRLVEFSEGFVEPDWCVKGHMGYVIKGSLSVDFGGIIMRFNQGDVVFIPEGIENKHKAILGIGERVLLVLFENV